MRWERGSALAAVGAVVLLSVASCAEDTSSPAPPTESSPFTVGHIPGGFEPITAGEGGAGLAWGDDSEGTNSPLTVLERQAGGDRQPVHVSFFGYENTQGQSPFGGQGAYEELEVDGHPATYLDGAADPDDRWSTLVVDFGDDLAARVSSPAASRDELVEILTAVDVPDPDASTAHIAAPRISPLPAGVTLVGSVDARVDLAQRTYVWGSDEIHGPPDSHVAMWVGDGEDLDRQLIVQTLPGDAADLAGIAASALGEVEGRVVDLDGHPAAVIESTATAQPPRLQRAVWIEASWGDLVHVMSRASDPLSLDDLAAVAASVRQASDEEWAALVDEFTDGGRLRPGPGYTTVARGEIEGVEWLLQGQIEDLGGTGEEELEVYPCFKLSSGDEDCDLQYSVGPGLQTTAIGAAELPLFVVATEHEAAKLRLIEPGGSHEVATTYNDELDVWVAVFDLGEDPSRFSCEAGAPARLEAIDREGNVTECLVA